MRRARAQQLYEPQLSATPNAKYLALNNVHTQNISCNINNFGKTMAQKFKRGVVSWRHAIAKQNNATRMENQMERYQCDRSLKTEIFESMHRRNRRSIVAMKLVSISCHLFFLLRSLPFVALWLEWEFKVPQLTVVQTAHTQCSSNTHNKPLKITLDTRSLHRRFRHLFCWIFHSLCHFHSQHCWQCVLCAVCIYSLLHIT